MDLTTGLGLERIQRQALLVLANVTQGLNTRITSMQGAWTAEDDQYYAALGRANPVGPVEHVSAANFHPGTAKGVLKWPVEKFPNVCTICYQAFSPNDDNNDQGEFYSDRLAIEITVKSERSEEEVNSWIQKTLDAAHLVLWDNRTLNNLVPEISTPPDTTIGDVQIRRYADGKGANWYWQGGALTYIVNKMVVY